MPFLDIFRKDFKKSNSYLLESLDVLDAVIASNKSLIFSFHEPSSYKSKFAAFIQLSADGEHLDPSDLEKIIYEVNQFIGSGGQLIILDDINYLLKYNPSLKLCKLVTNLRDIVSSSKSILIILARKRDLDAKLMSFLCGECIAR